MFQNTANQDLMFARYTTIDNMNFIIAEDTIHVKQTVLYSSLFHEITFQFTPPLNQRLVAMYNTYIWGAVCVKIHFL